MLFCFFCFGHFCVAFRSHLFSGSDFVFVHHFFVVFMELADLFFASFFFAFDLEEFGDLFAAHLTEVTEDPAGGTDDGEYDKDHNGNSGKNDNCGKAGGGSARAEKSDGGYGKEAGPEKTETSFGVIIHADIMLSSRRHGVSRGVHGSNEENKSTDKPDAQNQFGERHRGGKGSGDECEFIPGIIKRIDGSVPCAECAPIEVGVHAETVTGDDAEEENIGNKPCAQSGQNDAADGAAFGAFCDEDPHNGSEAQPPSPIEHGPFHCEAGTDGIAGACVEKHSKELVKLQADGMSGDIDDITGITEDKDKAEHYGANDDAEFGEIQDPFFDAGNSAPSENGGENDDDDNVHQEVFGSAHHIVEEVSQHGNPCTVGDAKQIDAIYKQNLENDIIKELARIKGIELRRAIDIYYSSKLASQIADGLCGIENMDSKYLAEDLIENEGALFEKHDGIG